MNGKCACRGKCLKCQVNNLLDWVDNSSTTPLTDSMWEFISNANECHGPDGKFCAGGAEGHAARVKMADSAKKLAAAATAHVESGGHESTGKALAQAMKEHQQLHKVSYSIEKASHSSKETPEEPQSKSVAQHVTRLKDAFEKAMETPHQEPDYQKHMAGLEKLSASDLKSVVKSLDVRPKGSHKEMLQQVRSYLGTPYRAMESILV